MDILTYGFTAMLVSAAVQFIKDKSGKDALLVLAFISIIASSVYTVVSQTIYFEAIAKNFIIIASSANMIFNSIKPFFKE